MIDDDSPLICEVLEEGRKEEEEEATEPVPMIFFNEKDPIVVASSTEGGGGGGGAIDDDGGDVIVMERVVRAAVILLVGVAIFVANVLVLASLLASPIRDSMTFYIMSLAVADLLCGVLVVPLSVYPAVVKDWVYGDIVCRLEGYLEVTLWTVTIYTLMWIGVDRYVAVRKPLRYETIQTKIRCQCWMLFSWVTAALLCSPPLLGFSAPTFNPDSCICMLDWRLMVPHGITLACLVLGPSLLTIGYTYSYVFRTIRRARRNRRRISLMHDLRSSASAVMGAAGAAEKETALQTETLGNPYNGVAFALLVLFAASWMPFVVLHVYEQLMTDDGHLEVPLLRFLFTWLGILNCFWKSIVYILLSAQFRASLRTLLDVCCCRCYYCCCRTAVDKGSSGGGGCSTGSSRRTPAPSNSSFVGHDSSDTGGTFDGLR